MLLVPPNAVSTHPHSQGLSTGPSPCVEAQAPSQANNSNSSSSSSPSHPTSPSPPVTIKQQPQSPPPSPGPHNTSTDHPGAPVPNGGQPHPHMSGLSEAHYPPVSTAVSSSQPGPVVTGRSPQAPPAPLSAPGTPAPSTPTPAPVTTRPSSGGSASGGSGGPVVTSNSVGPGGVAGAGGGSAVTTSGAPGVTGVNSTAGAGGALPPAMPVPGPSVTPSGASSAGPLPQHHPLLGYVPHGANKILSRNINGTHIRGPGSGEVLPSAVHHGPVGGPHHPPAGPYSGGPGGGSGGTGAPGGGTGQQPPTPASAYHPSRSKHSPVPCESGGSQGDKKNAMVAVTSNPSNESELQLYRVLQRANLLNYYDTFISQGGDDVQQLCEAGEEEFLEIMALVGMASKPLHVRRLQKALQEWVSNPGIFLMPLKSAAAPAPTASGMPVPPQLDAFNLLSTLTTTYRQQHQQQPSQSSNMTHHSPRGSSARIPPPVAAAAAAAVAAAAPHTAPYQRPQPYPSPENLTARKSPPTGGVAPQPGSVSPTDYRRVLEAAWALRAAGQQDPRGSNSPPGGKVSPPGSGGPPNNRGSTWPSTMSPPSSTTSRSPGHHTDTLHNSSSDSQPPFLPGTPVPWFPFLVPVNKL